jgi:hypothetical protein
MGGTQPPSAKVECDFWAVALGFRAGRRGGTLAPVRCSTYPEAMGEGWQMVCDALGTG